MMSGRCGNEATSDNNNKMCLKGEVVKLTA